MTAQARCAVDVGADNDADLPIPPVHFEDTDASTIDDDVDRVPAMIALVPVDAR